jgi:pimeloyl-ACP methyl ester carboxylesterase
VPREELNGVGISYDVHGSGETVVLVCGTGQPAFSWDLHQVPAITAAGYQVVTFDNRGMTPSDSPPSPYTAQGMAEDLAGLIEHLGIAPCRVAGLSLGALITQELALARPELVRAAVLMGTFGRQDTFRRALLEAWVEFDETGIELPRLYDVVYASFSLFSPRTLSDDEAMSLYIEATTAMPSWDGPGRLGQHRASLSYENRLQALGGIRVPAMVLAFEHDVLTPPHLCAEVAEAVPGCRYVEVAGAGHSGPFEKPDEVNSAMLEFFAEV